MFPRFMIKSEKVSKREAQLVAVGKNIHQYLCYGKFVTLNVLKPTSMT